jgi:hypothetical protein
MVTSSRRLDDHHADYPAAAAIGELARSFGLHALPRAATRRHGPAVRRPHVCLHPCKTERRRNLMWALFLPLVFAANIVLATLAWIVVG